MAEGAKDETDGDKTERKGQTECLMRFEQTVPAGVCQQADMQIIFFFHPQNLQMFQRLKSQVCLSAWCLCDSRAATQSHPLRFNANFDSNLESSSRNRLTL